MAKRCINCRRLESWDYNEYTYDEAGRTQIKENIGIIGCGYMEWIVVDPLKSCCKHFKKRRKNVSNKRREN